MDNDPGEISQVAFCVTDFSKYMGLEVMNKKYIYLAAFSTFYNVELPGVLKYGISSCASRIR